MAPVRIIRGLLIGIGIGLVASVALSSVLLGILIGLLSTIASIALLRSGNPSREVERSQLKLLMIVFFILALASAGILVLFLI